MEAPVNQVAGRPDVEPTNSSSMPHHITGVKFTRYEYQRLEQRLHRAARYMDAASLVVVAVDSNTLNTRWIDEAMGQL
ncbi:hypothetical protein ECG_07238 [Echinococcus granulosus]|uniref:Diguanylate cyclase n=1 Tax=Echinococcus granulosus TaxID=6210 RepID=A0A068WP67_ECHGR|nr:hypothetical protein ECG_07238 [Echinococcus granulosus]CDS21904.1 hypothetical protein EgrG_002022500 [Echinococcus granulosus]